MAPSTVTCNAALSPVSKKLVAPSVQPSTPGVPLTQQFHWARPQVSALASSSAVGAVEAPRTNRVTFIRPDFVDAADDALAAFVQTTNRPSSAPAKPQFRSALEQVSYETNNTLLEQTRPRKSEQLGLFGRAVRILRK